MTRDRFGDKGRGGKMEKRIFMLWGVALALILAGCATPRTWVSQPASATAQNDVFQVRYTPLHTDKNYISQFRLEIQNKSGKGLEIDWVKTRYLYNGQPAGGFIFEGLDETNVNNPPPDVVPPGAAFQKLIAPLKFIAWKGYKPGYRDLPNFSAGPLPDGRNGILLVTRQDGRIFEETLSVTIKIETK
jgi:hypothetical protein